MSDEFRAVNPRCTVPVLELADGTRLTENAGIAAWAEAHQPEPALLGSTPTEKGLVASWNARVEFEGLHAAMDTVRNTLKGMTDRALPGPRNFAQSHDLAERGKARLADFFEVLEEQLQTRDYLAIDRFSVADISALVLLDFTAWIHIQPPDCHAATANWRERINKRPSTKA